MSGVTAEGFVIKTLEEIKLELQQDFQAEFGSNVELDEREPIGQLIGIMADRFASLWELAEDIYHSGTADGAVGASLDNVAALTGTARRAATYSLVTVTCTGAPATVIPAGRIFRTADTAARFATIADATIEGGGTVAVPCKAVESGQVKALAGSLTVIETPVAGLTSVTNSLDADEGEPIESDYDLRLRRASELQSSANAALEAVRSAVAQIAEVESCTVFENDTAFTNGDGMPPHSIEVLVHGGDDTEIAQKIFETKAAGITAYGDTVEVVVDSEGNSHNIGFSRPDVQDIYCDIALDVDANEYPVGGDALIETAILAWAESTFGAGRDVTASGIEAVCFRTVGGVLNAVANIGLAASPATRATITIGGRQRAKFDSSRTTVVSTPVTP